MTFAGKIELSCLKDIRRTRDLGLHSSSYKQWKNGFWLLFVCTVSGCGKIIRNLRLISVISAAKKLHQIKFKQEINDGHKMLELNFLDILGQGHQYMHQ